jgi:CRISPR-associated protein Csm2
VNTRETGNYRGGSFTQDDVVTRACKNVKILLNKDEDPHGKQLIATAEELGEHMVNKGMTTSQIRKIFAEFKKLKFKDEGPYQANMKRAKLAYTAGRHKQVRDLQKVLDSALLEVGTDEQKYRRFVDFFEAIVAYHKRFDGKE